MVEKNKEFTKKEYQVGFSADLNTQCAILFLRDNMPGGFNLSEFCRGRIVGFAKEFGFQPPVDDNGNANDKMSVFRQPIDIGVNSDSGDII